MPIIYSKPAVQKAVLPLSTVTNTGRFPSRVADWLANACDKYLHIDHWKPFDDSFSSLSRYGTRTAAHINRIPVEILGEIFMHCLVENVYIQTAPTPTSFSPSPQADPQVLGEVCRFWRDVTLSTPSLWSKMKIYDPQPMQVRKVSLWLDRSREYPLDITVVQMAAGVTPKDHAATNEILSLLVGQVGRWKKIYFRFNSTGQLPLLSLPIGAPAALESAYVDTWKWEHTSADRFWEVLHSSPSLREADWATYTSRLPNHAPWAQLTSVTMHHGLSVEECMLILRGCQHIVTFRVYALSSYDTLIDPHGPLTLPKLQKLSFLGYIESTPFFNRLTLPSLVSLEITNTHPRRHYERRSYASFRDLLCRSSCNLRRFRFHNPEINEDDLHEYLSAPQMTSLRELELCVPMTDRTIISLTQKGTNSPFLPKLEVICIDKTHASDGLVSDMVFSRIAPNTPAPLRAARIKLKSQSHPHDLTVFQNMVQNDWLYVFVT